MPSAVAVNNELLAWARRQAQFDIPDAALVVGQTPDQLTRWERGLDVPSWTTLTKLSAAYGLPIAVFFLSEVPGIAGDSPPADFRLAPRTYTDPKKSRDLRLAVRRVHGWRQIAGHLNAAYERDIPPTTLEAQPADVGAQLRLHLGIDDDIQLSWPSTENALLAWRNAVEDTGVLVFSLRLDRNVCRGFSLSDGPDPPAIALATEAEQAKIFTILHEYAHLMLRRDGVCDQFQDSTAPGAVERFCNEVAANALMPETVLVRAIQRIGAMDTNSITRDSLKPYARLLKVSVPALALRLEELGRAPRGTYDRLDLEARDTAPDRWRRGGGGGNTWPSPRIAERGEAFSRAVFEAWQSGRISLGDASRVMNMPPRYVRHISRSIESRDARLG